MRNDVAKQARNQWRNKARLRRAALESALTPKFGCDKITVVFLNCTRIVTDEKHGFGAGSVTVFHKATRDH